MAEHFEGQGVYTYGVNMALEMEEWFGAVGTNDYQQNT